MSRPPDDELAPEVRALLERERAIPAQPPAVRARMLARARAALEAGGASREGPSAAPRRVRWAAAAALVCLASAAAVAAAYRIGIRAKRRGEPSVALTPPLPTLPAAPSRPGANVPAARPAANGTPPAPSSPPSPPSSPSPSPSRADVTRGELRLLRLARAAVAREDFAAALRPLAEHRRRFKDGRLAEEREALRVKALAGLGRTDEAVRAAAEFEARFPRSVLLPTVSRVRAPGPELRR